MVLLFVPAKHPINASAKRKTIQLIFVFPLPGEIVRLALVSADQKTKIFVAIVPDSIVAKSGPCSLEVIRLMPQFALALVRAKGYGANETVTFFSKSYDESHQQDVEGRQRRKRGLGDAPGRKRQATRHNGHVG